MSDSRKQTPFVPVKLKISKYPTKKNPKTEMVPSLGLVMGKDHRRCIIVVAEQQSATDVIEIVNIGGSDLSEENRKTVKLLSERINLAECSIVGKYLCESRLFIFLAKGIVSGELPDHTMDIFGSLIQLPPNSLLSSKYEFRKGENYYLLGVQQTSRETESIKVPLEFLKNTSNGFVVMTTHGDFDGVTFGNAVIYDSCNRLIAISVFSGKSESNSLVIVCVPLDYSNRRERLLLAIESAMK